MTPKSCPRCVGMCYVVFRCPNVVVVGCAWIRNKEKKMCNRMLKVGSKAKKEACLSCDFFFFGLPFTVINYPFLSFYKSISH
jgi:hypothetical protein